MKRQSLCFFAVLLSLLMVLTGCGAGKEAAADTAYVDAPAMDAPAYDDGPVPEAGELSGAMPVVSTRKLIHRSEIRLETTEFDEAVEEIRALVTEMGGYMESSSVNGSMDYGRYASFVSRIPANRFADANGRIAGIGNVTSSSEWAEDVTDQYYDVEAELDALTIQQDRLLAMMEQATDMEDLIALEEALTDVRYRINDRTGTIKRYDGLIEYATVEIGLEEVIEYTEEEPETFGDRISGTFRGSVEFVRDFGEGLILVIVAVVPFVVVYGGMAALIACAVLLIIKAAKKNRKK